MFRIIKKLKKEFASVKDCSDCPIEEWCCASGGHVLNSLCEILEDLPEYVE